MNPVLPDFETIANSTKGPQKLREMILALAVRGKLVPQNPEDEPASELLKKITAEKARMVKEGLIKKPKPLPPIDPDEVPYVLPVGWEWCRMNNITSYIQRGKGPQYTDLQQIPVVSQKCVQWSGFDLSKARFLSPDALEKYAEERFLRSGDLLWNSTGTGTIGRINQYVHEDNKYEIVVADSHVTVLRPLITHPEFLLAWISSPFIQSDIENRASGSTNQIELATSMAQQQIVPLPPLDEQQRIVERVNELMSLVDELEEKQVTKRSLRISAGKAALRDLTEADGPNAFQHAWERLEGNFEALFSRDLENIKALRQTVLSLAVRGKLVPQNPEDEPASELLKKITAEKARMVKEGLIKKPKPLPPIDPHEVPYELPEGWEWCRLDELGDFGAGATPTRGNPEFYGGEILWFKSGELNSDFISTSEECITEKALNKFSLRLNMPGDVLIAMYGATIGKSAITTVEATTNQAVCGCTPFNGLLNTYLLLFYRAWLHRFISQGAGGAQPNISKEKIIHSEFPLPPLTEQHRIVDRVDSLLNIIGQLDKSVQRSEQIAERYTDSVVRALSIVG